MTPLEYSRFLDLRDALHEEIRACLALDGHCKSYEGTFEIVFPAVFDGSEWRINLHCYVVGPSRHYEWSGDTFVSAFEKCEVDVREWIKESARWREENREQADPT